mgnify:CR=1 FL=1
MIPVEKNMFSIILAVIYLAFIGLGLPDSLLGAAWPTMVDDINVSLSYAGIISMIISAGTILSSLISDKLVNRLGTGTVTVLSVMLTALALLGFSVSGSFGALCMCAVPYGLGAGAVDAALNNYVALNYSGRHINWLHCFWGIGASLGPYIISFSIGKMRSWRSGYGIISLIQITLTVILALSLPMWKKDEKVKVTDKRRIGLGDVFRISGIRQMLFCFFCYCAFESTAGLWASSYLAGCKGWSREVSAGLASLFYMGITIGRLVGGFISDRLGDRKMIGYGQTALVIGIMITLIPINSPNCCLMGFLLMGIGAAPIYPCIIHSTPLIFGAEISERIIGVQMASAYVGSTFVPHLFGIIAEHSSIAAFPIFILMLVILTAITTHNLWSGKIIRQ